MSQKREPFFGLDGLLGSLGHTPETVGRFELLDGREVPQPYRRLLVHGSHMTVTLEQFYRSRVNLEVLEQSARDRKYARMILLALEETGQVVQFGVVRLDPEVLEPSVRDAVLSGRIPLGRLLIKHVALRCVDPIWFARITPSRRLAGYFAIESSVQLYGRMAMIYCGSEPTVELLEILAPIPTSPAGE